MKKELLIPVKALIVVTQEGIEVRVVEDPKPEKKTTAKPWTLPGGYL